MLTKWVLHWWHRFRLSLDYLSMMMMDYLSSRHFIKVQLMLPCSSIYSRATEDSLGFTWCIWFYLVSKYHKVKYKKCDITCTIKNSQLDRLPKKNCEPNFEFSIFLTLSARLAPLEWMQTISTVPPWGVGTFTYCTRWWIYMFCTHVSIKGSMISQSYCDWKIDNSAFSNCFAKYIFFSKLNLSSML